MKAYVVNGTYGSQETPCEVFVYPYNGGSWYCVEDSHNVNFTYDAIESGVNVETLQDSDYFYAGKKIQTLEELETAVNS
jgi:hypothetical protein